MNKKKKSTNTSPYPDEVIDRLARAFYPAILACWNSEEGQREFAAWQAEQAHHATSKEKQSVPDGERPVVHIAIVCGFWQGASIQGAPCFLFCFTPDDFNGIFLWEELYQSGTIPPQQFIRVKLQNNARHIPRIFPEIPAAYPDHYTSHGWTSEIRYSRMERCEEGTLP